MSHQKKHRKKIILTLGLFTFTGLIATMPLIFAFESHIINVTAKIESGIANHIVINEVYYDTGIRQRGNKTEEEIKNEWIELYNPTDTAVNLRNWSITDNSGIIRTISGNRRLRPGQFAIIAIDSDTFNFWNIPRGALKIRLREEIGNGLDNIGDRVILFDPSGNKIDGMSYGEDITELNPSIPGVAEGHSLARSPKGFDTDRAPNWYELETPNPGTNPHSNASNEIEINFNEEKMNEENEEYKDEEENNEKKSEEIIIKNTNEQNNTEINNEIISPDENKPKTTENTEESTATTTENSIMQENQQEQNENSAAPDTTENNSIENTPAENTNKNSNEQNSQNESDNTPTSPVSENENQEISNNTPETGVAISY